MICSHFFSTSDLYDAFGDYCQSRETQFRQYGRCTVFSGKIRTVRCMRDNVLLRRMLETKSKGEVLVIDGSGYLGSALMRSTRAELGLNDGWAGCRPIRRNQRHQRPVSPGLRSQSPRLNSRKSEKHGAGQVDVVVSFAVQLLCPANGFTVMTMA